ncbi:hypothetical protein [Brevundimonas sp.]|uniref:hypothetical protein n=1 Tax=Brevundimonas sp. TaxID=1871086 RepID=UPI002FC8FCE1
MGLSDRKLLVPHEWRAHVNPWVKDDELADLLILRGAIVWSYAHIEQVITEITIRATYLDAYRGLRSQPPFSMSARLTHLRKILNMDGPLARYRRYGLAMIVRYERAREVRNQMAHSDMFPISLSGREFREIVIADGTITSKRAPYWPGELERVAESAARFSQRCQAVLYGLNARKLLPTFDEGAALVLAERGDPTLAD